MRIAVDLDDVLADLIQCLIDTHREITGEVLSREEALDWNVFPLEVHDHVRYQGGYTRLAPLPQAKEFLLWLRQRHEVVIVTYRNEEARAVTEEWLALHVSNCYDRLFFAGGSKLPICQKLKVECMVDDSCNQLPLVTSSMQIPGILIDTPMNRHIQDTDLIHRAANLREAQGIIAQLEQTS